MDNKEEDITAKKGPSRRDFMKIAVGATAGTIAATSLLKASPQNILSEDRMGVLVDTTVCVGCRHCEWACKTAHNLATPALDSYNDTSVFSEMRRPDDTALTVVNQYNNESNPLLPINVKVQCMHCDKPACVSACIVGALSKSERGAVKWDSNKCIGCRYCMVACPFQIPSFEFHKAIQPLIHKCDFCSARNKQGKIPACVDMCPVEALTYGPRSELIKIARSRIKRKPEIYKDIIYGEYEVGGTSWLYLACEDFEKLDFPKLAKKPAPGVSETIQHGIFAYFVPPVALYALLGGLMWMSKVRKEIQVEEDSESVTEDGK